MAQPNIRIDIASVFKDKGFKQADKASGALDENFKKLARTFATVFSTAAIIKFGKDAVRAFEEDEKAAVRLSQALNGLNLGFATPEVERYLSSLEKSTAVADDELRPAFQRLAQTTRTITTAQDLLATAIDVSAGSGVDLQTVVNDLSRAYVGQTRGLTKYNLGLTQAELKTIKFEEIQEKLNSQFGGQRAALLDTYGGKVMQVGIAYERMQETIGEGLVDAFGMLSGEQGIAGATSAMEEFGTISADVIRGIGSLLGNLTSQIGGTAGIQGILDLATKTGNPLATFITGLQRQGQSSRGLMFPTLGVGQPGIEARVKRAEDEARKRQEQMEALRTKAIRQTEKLNRLKKISAAIDERANRFDEKRIQIQAALQGRISAEERSRLQEMLLIEELRQAVREQDVDKAEALYDKLLKLQDQTEVLAESLISLEAGDPFNKWDDYFAKAHKLVSGLKTAMEALLMDVQDISKQVADLLQQSLLLQKQRQAALELARTEQITAYLNASAATQLSGDLSVAAALAAIAEANAALAAATTEAEKNAAQAFLDGATAALDAANTLLDSVPATAEAAALAAVGDALDLEVSSMLALLQAGLPINEPFPGVAGAVRANNQPTVYVNVEGNVVTEQDLANTINNIMLDYQRGGGSILYNAQVL